MILSRSKPVIDNQNQQLSKLNNKNKIPDLEEFLEKRDYTGALTLLEFLQNEKENNLWIQVWTGYCYFHLGDYKQALQIYETLEKSKLDARISLDEILMNKAVCYFYLGMYSESQEVALKLADTPLTNRLLFHLAHKLGDEALLMERHQMLRDVAEDQLCLASIHYLRAHYQEAIHIYKKLLLDNRNLLALNVYVALCYYKLDYYDVSQEVLGVYLNQHPNSTVAINLKACNVFRLYNGKAAENELRNLTTDQNTLGHDLVKHNLVVFRNGEGALKVLPGLVDVIGEARLNLVGRRLRGGEAREALALLEGLEPAVPLQYILKGVVHAALGQELDSEEHIRTAQQCLQLVGGSTSECDTIPGRQCMASSYFLYGQFEEVLVYLNSIKSFFVNDDTFNYNYGQAKCATGYYKEGEEALLLIQDESIKSSFTYLAVLCRCLVMNKHSQAAWEVCQKAAGTPDYFSLLQIIANDSYRMGDFLVSARAFHMLDRLEPNPEFWEGMRGACAGVAQLVAAGNNGDALMEVLQLLKTCPHPPASTLHTTLSHWAQDMHLII